MYVFWKAGQVKKMLSLSRELRNVQNPALGAAVLWRFSCGYFSAHPTRASVPLPLAYIVLPLIFHEETRLVIKSTLTTSGLLAAMAKFGESSNPRQDLLLAIHTRTVRLRPLTTKALGIAIGTNLISVQQDALVVPLSLTPVSSVLAPEVRQMLRDAEKLGVWFSQLTVHEITTILKVRL